MRRGAAAILSAAALGLCGLAQVPARPALTGKVAVDAGSAATIRVTRDNEVPLVEIKGQATHGGLMVGTAKAGTRVVLDGVPLMIGPKGEFVFGFDRDGPDKAMLRVEPKDADTLEIEVPVLPRKWDIQNIDGLPPDKVTPPPEALEQIKREAVQKKDARKRDTEGSWFAEKFIWPTEGRISGVFGSQRILNGEPRAPHYGLDIAASEGTPIKAPAGGIVRLAVTGFFYEGGLVFLDHGHGLISYMMHMSRVDVKSGQEVRQGDVIGAVGKTGRVTAAHLHWGMFWLDAHIDPGLLLPPMPPADQSVK